MQVTYSEKLKDPRWQKKRLKIFERDEWRCQKCFDAESMLAVHHRYYIVDREPWDYPDKLLVTLCEDCHESERLNYDNAEDILSMLRILFWTEGIHSIIYGFRKMQLVYPPEVMADMLEWVLSDPDILSELLDRYFAYLKTDLRERQGG